MKKKIYLLLFAFFLGGTMAYITYKKVKLYIPKQEVSSYQAYQVGVYKEYQNAVFKAQEAKGAIIVPQNDTYQVIVAIAKSDRNKAKIEELLHRDNVSYYKKEITLNEEEKEVVEDYEVMMEQATDLDALKLMNQKLLKTLQERVK